MARERAEILLKTKQQYSFSLLKRGISISFIDVKTNCTISIWCCMNAIKQRLPQTSRTGTDRFPKAFFLIQRRRRTCRVFCCSESRLLFSAYFRIYFPKYRSDVLRSDWDLFAEGSAVGSSAVGSSV